MPIENDLGSSIAFSEYIDRDVAPKRDVLQQREELTAVLTEISRRLERQTFLFEELSKAKWELEDEDERVGADVAQFGQLLLIEDLHCEAAFYKSKFYPGEFKRFLARSRIRFAHLGEADREESGYGERLDMYIKIGEKYQLLTTD